MSKPDDKFVLLATLAAFLIAGGAVALNFLPGKTPSPNELPSRNEAAADLQAIARSYAILIKAESATRPLLTVKSGDTVHAAALAMSRFVFLNDASVYLFNLDPLGPAARPKTVIKGDAADPSAQLDPDFARATLSVVLAANLPSDAPPATTPVAWARGLRDDGTWAPDSPWAGLGGIIAFLDGHVEWFTKLPAKGDKALVKYGTTTPTVNIHEALPLQAIVLRAEPNK